MTSTYRVMGLLLVAIFAGFVMPEVTLARSLPDVVPGWLAGTWEQNPAPRGIDGDRLGFSIDGYYFHEITREVGQYGTNLPYPTPCRHRETGRIEYLGPANKATIDRYARSRRPAPAYTIRVRIQSVELVPWEHNGAFCPDWLEDERGRVARGESAYDWHFAAPRPGVISDPWRGVEFVKAR